MHADAAGAAAAAGRCCHLQRPGKSVRALGLRCLGSTCLLTPSDGASCVPSFIQESKPEIIKQLTADVKSCEEDLDKLKASKEYLERAVKETEGSITELLRTNDTLARQILKQ